MARILIAWELGDSFGHLAPCLRLAEELQRRGHAVVLALKDVRLPVASSSLNGIAVLQAPSTQQRRSDDRRVQVNYADVLSHCGFSNASDVVARLSAWLGMFSLARPDVLVADHAPTALLAAHLAGIPHLAVGNGFVTPPAIFPWPSIRPWETISDEALLAAEQRLDRVTDAAQKALGYLDPVPLRKVFGARDVLNTFSELDHYGERPNGRYAGHIISASEALEVDWRERQGSKVIAYLRPGVPGFAKILRALARLDAEVLCCAPGVMPDMARRFATRRLRIALIPVDLPLLFREADLAVGYGGSGFSALALLSGVPLALRPRYVEQALLARRIETMGAGRTIDPGRNVEAIAASLQAMLNVPDYRLAALAFKERYLHVSSDLAVERTLALIEQAFLEGWRTDCTRHAQELKEKPLACLH